MAASSPEAPGTATTSWGGTSAQPLLLVQRASAPPAAGEGQPSAGERPSHCLHSSHCQKCHKLKGAVATPPTAEGAATRRLPGPELTAFMPAAPEKLLCHSCRHRGHCKMKRAATLLPPVQRILVPPPPAETEPTTLMPSAPEKSPTSHNTDSPSRRPCEEAAQCWHCRCSDDRYAATPVVAALQAATLKEDHTSPDHTKNSCL